LFASWNKLIRPIFVVNFKLSPDLSGFGSLRQQAAPAASVVADLTIEACRGLFNYLRRANAALSDNSIQTMMEAVSVSSISAQRSNIFGCYQSVTDFWLQQFHDLRYGRRSSR
jgi:hypothetical protein